MLIEKPRSHPANRDRGECNVSLGVRLIDHPTRIANEPNDGTKKSRRIQCN